MKIAITTYCTENYTYAIRAQIPLCISALRYARIKDAVFIMSGDDSKNVTEAFDLYSKALKILNIESHRVILNVECNKNQSHEKKSNLVIAKMQGAAWQLAREFDVDAIWSLESDILPQVKTLRTLIDAVNFDNGWYDVAMNTYPNSEFLGGRGSPQHWIFPSIWDDEKDFSKETLEKMEKKKLREKELQEKDEKYTEEDIKEWKSLDEDIKKSPPKLGGNVHSLNGMAWKPRGWLTSAYPGVGIGAILPTDWVGLGSTLITRKALELANFSSYDGGGTQDLWLCWKIWYPNNIKLAVVTHALCDHVKRKVIDGKESLEIMHAFHETDPRAVGHLRCSIRSWDGI